MMYTNIKPLFWLRVNKDYWITLKGTLGSIHIKVAWPLLIFLYAIKSMYWYCKNNSFIFVLLSLTTAAFSVWKPTDFTETIPRLRMVLAQKHQFLVHIQGFANHRKTPQINHFIKNHLLLNVCFCVCVCVLE